MSQMRLPRRFIILIIWYYEDTVKEYFN